MDEDAGGIVFVVGVATDVSTLVANEDPLARTAGQTLGQDAAGKPGTHYEVIEHFG
jgi:hypothetical protein